MSERLPETPAAVIENDPGSGPTAAVSSLIVTFQRTLKAFRLYTEDHPTLVTAVGEFHRELTRVLAAEDELVLRVAQGRILCQGRTVYENPDRDEGLAFRLFIHGMREISFHRDVPVREIFDLCLVLHRTLRTRTPADDLPSLLWEKDFSAINFIILEDFLEGADRTEYDRFMSESRGGERPSTSLRSTARPVLDRLAAQAPPPEGRFTTVYQLSEEERRGLDGLIAQERSRDLFRDLARIVLPLAERCPGSESGELLGMLVRTVVALLSEGAFRAAAGLAEGIARVAGGTAATEARTPLGEALGAVDPAHLVEAVRPYLLRVRDEDLDRLARVFRLFGPRVRPAVEVLLGDPAMQSAALELIRRDNPGLTPGLLARLCGDRADPDLVLRALSTLGDRGDARLLPALKPLLAHPDDNIRRRTFQVIRQIGTEACFPLLREALRSDDPDTRLLAIGALEGLPPDIYRDVLLAIAESPDFLTKDYFEKRGVLLALGRARDRTSEEHLLAAVRRRSFLRRQASAELRASAVAALAIRGSAWGLAEVRRALGDPSPMVRQAAAAALKQAPDPA